MNFVERLEAQSSVFVEEAAAALERQGMKHYVDSGAESTRDRMQELMDLLLECLRGKTLLPMVKHAERVANERYRAGFGLEEVQTSFNVMEESLWKHLVHEAPVAELAEDLGLIGTVLGAGKDQLARTYVSLASHHHAPSLDLHALFGGAAHGA
ncbi:MAG TPA: hypothetical protein VHM65_01945 [Candidatus Lustribacter sp.]|nr:hypothetical protein [Candidatus Lustribacter sp.]